MVDLPANADLINSVSVEIKLGVEAENVTELFRSSIDSPNHSLPDFKKLVWSISW